MVFKLGCSFLGGIYLKLNRQRERRFLLYYQKKYLSSMARFQRQQTYIRKKIDNIIVWYDEFTGMDEVRLTQRRVLEDEENFRKAQENRRTILNQLTEVQQKLKDLYSELDNTSKGDDRYVLLVTQEHKLLKEEKLILEKFAMAEKLERDTFAALSSSVKLSHEKERAQSERTKYWSIIGSVLGTVLGIVGSSVNNHFKMNELKQLIKNSTNMQLIDCLNSYLETNEKIIEKFKTTLTEKHNIVKVEELLNAVQSRLSRLEKTVTKVEKNTEKNIAEIISINDEGVVTVSNGVIEESLKKDLAQLKLLLFTVAVFSVLMHVVSRYS